MLLETNQFRKCDCELCGQIISLLKGDNDIGHTVLSTNALLESVGFIPNGGHIYDVIGKNRNDITFLLKEHTVINRSICEELRHKSRCRVRLSTGQISSFKKYCSMKECAEKNIDAFIPLLQYDLQFILSKVKNLLSNNALYELYTLVRSYIHEQEFVKAYLRLINECSRQTWSTLCSQY